jgi:hypothetical protein
VRLREYFHSSASFDGEETGSRLARRKRNWIAEVDYIELSGSSEPKPVLQAAE